MAKKSQAKKTKRPQQSSVDTGQDVPVSRQTAGGVAGAILAQLSPDRWVPSRAA